MQNVSIAVADMAVNVSQARDVLRVGWAPFEQLSFFASTSNRTGKQLRKDVDPKEVARLYLEGMTIKKLATYFLCHKRTIEFRLQRARIDFPELPWKNRKPIKFKA